MPAVLDRPAAVLTAEPATLPDELAILVTQADIDKGEQGASNWCPLVIAARRQISAEGWWTMTIAGTLSFLSKHKGAERRSWYSYKAGRFAANFDFDADSVHPERFVFRRDKRPCLAPLRTVARLVWSGYQD